MHTTVSGNPINGGPNPKFLYFPLNLTLTIALTLPTLLTLQKYLFNMVQEFGTAVYRIAQFPNRSECLFRH